MGFTSGTREVGDDAVSVCPVSDTGVRVKNTGDVTIYIGGPDVQAGGDSPGYPLDPGGSEDFTAAKPKESPVVPSPPGDLDRPVLYARAAPGTRGRVAFFVMSA